MVKEVPADASEEWRPVVSYEGLYEVSRRGKVRSLWFGRIRSLALSRKRDGYITVTLYKDGTRRHLSVHSLVAGAFIGPRPTGYEVNHKDADKGNNDVGNLEYLSPLDNTRHALENDLILRGTDNMRAKLNDEAIKAIRAFAATLTVPTLARMFGVTKPTIRDVINRVTWTHIP